MNIKEFKNAFDLLVGQLVGIGEKDLARLLSERLEDLCELPENSPVVLSIKKIQIFSNETIALIKDQTSLTLTLITFRKLKYMDNKHNFLQVPCEKMALQY